MNPNLQLRSLAFDIPHLILPTFGAAVPDKAGLEHDLFYKHYFRQSAYSYYFAPDPLQTGPRPPMLFCLNEGTFLLYKISHPKIHRTYISAKSIGQDCRVI